MLPPAAICTFAAVADDLLQPRNILVGVVGLLGQNRDVLALHPFERQPVHRHRRELLVHRQPVRLPGAGAPHETEVAIGLDADQIRGIGNDGGILRGDIAAAFGFERAASTFSR